MGFRAWGSGFGVQGLGLLKASVLIQGLGLGVRIFRFRVRLGLIVWGFRPISVGFGVSSSRPGPWDW